MKMILVIEDNPFFSKQLAGFLEKRRYKTKIANSISQTEKEVCRYDIDLICLDYQLPHKIGLSLFNTIIVQKHLNNFTNK